MKFILNDREEDFEIENLTISEMLILKKFSFKMNIIKLNGVLVPKEEYNTRIINDGDNVQMFYLMSGG